MAVMWQANYREMKPKDEPEKKLALPNLTWRKTFVRSSPTIRQAIRCARMWCGPTCRVRRLPSNLIDWERQLDRTLYDLKRNVGHITLGVSHDTSQFACDSLRLRQARSVRLPANRGKSQKVMLESFVQENLHPADPFPLAMWPPHGVRQSAHRAGIGKSGIEGKLAGLPMVRPHGPHRLWLPAERLSHRRQTMFTSRSSLLSQATPSFPAMGNGDSR